MMALTNAAVLVLYGLAMAAVGLAAYELWGR
jgi:hypothetical protein